MKATEHSNIQSMRSHQHQELDQMAAVIMARDLAWGILIDWS